MTYSRKSKSDYLIVEIVIELAMKTASLNNCAQFHNQESLDGDITVGPDIRCKVVLYGQPYGLSDFKLQRLEWWAAFR